MAPTVLSSELRDWPAMLRRIAELIGPELALVLGGECGGLDSLYIPLKPHAGHIWAQAIGIGAFAILTKEFGGERVSLPRGTYVRLQKRQIIELGQAGFSARKIALKCRTSERYVRRLLAPLGLTHGQPRQVRAKAAAGMG